jgi:hypothetical protein
MSIVCIPRVGYKNGEVDKVRFYKHYTKPRDFVSSVQSFSRWMSLFKTASEYHQLFLPLDWPLMFGAIWAKTPLCLPSISSINCLRIFFILTSWCDIPQGDNHSIVIWSLPPHSHRYQSYINWSTPNLTLHPSFNTHRRSHINHAIKSFIELDPKLPTTPESKGLNPTILHLLVFSKWLLADNSVPIVKLFSRNPWWADFLRNDWIRFTLSTKSPMA